ncbi:hypothetical protein GCM10011408_01180 [Dyella caseinilytica]|nr:hypothetical protein GCM10011408_01180 [Dyella caseinilytica]
MSKKGALHERGGAVSVNAHAETEPVRYATLRVAHVPRQGYAEVCSRAGDTPP